MESSKTNNLSNKNNALTQLWRLYFPYWPVFLILLGLSISSVWLYLNIELPLYEANATLLIKDERKGLDDSRMIESLNLISTKKIVENEIEVLTSRSLMSEVVTNLKLYASVHVDSKWRGNPAYSFSPVRIEVKDPLSVRDVPKISFSYNKENQRVTFHGKSYPVNEWVTTAYGQLRFLQADKSETFNDGALYFSLVDPRKVTLALIKNLEVTASSKLSTVINLKLRVEDPKMAEDILNELLIVYNRAAVNDKNALASNTLQFVQARLDFVSQHLDSIERKIQEFKSSKGAVDIGSQGKLFLENVSTNDQKLSQVNMQLSVLDQVERYVETKNTNGGIVPSTVGISDPLLTGLLEKLYDAELQKEKLKKTTGENSPLMLAIADQIEKIKPSILENIRSQRKSIEANKANITSTNSSYASLLQAIPQKERTLVEISRQHNIESSIYSFLLQKREEAALSNSSTVPDSRIVDSAESSILPVSPNKKIAYLFGAIGALVLGICIVASKEMFSRTILYRTEIETMSSMPIIGEIGNNRSKNAIVIAQDSTILLAEQFRKLRASLGFVGIGQKRRKLLITSSIPGEGKSFVTANLALSLAITGKKVVVVEADMTSPSVSKKLNIHEEIGLSNYLLGEVEPEEIVKRTELNSNLFVIPAGAFPPNPSELIVHPRMADLITYLDNIFDYVLLDSAPVCALSDAYILSSYCDATLFVIRHGFTPKIVIERLDKNNKVNELKNAAIVFNAVRKRGFTNDIGYGDGYMYSRKKKNKRSLLRL